MVSYHSNRKVTDTEVGTRSGAVWQTMLLFLFFDEYGRLWDLGLERQLNKQSLMGRPSRSLGDRNAGSCVDCGGPVREASEGSEDFASNRDRGHSCSILAKYLAAFALV